MSAFRQIVQWAKTPQGRRVILTVADAVRLAMKEDDSEDDE